MIEEEERKEEQRVREESEKDIGGVGEILSLPRERVCPFCSRLFIDRCICGAYVVDGDFANERKKRVDKKVCKGGVEDGF